MSLNIPGALPYTDDKDEFFARRHGKITASRISDVIAGGAGKTKNKYLYQLAIERLTGKPIRGGFVSRATEHGNSYEDEALELYSLLNCVDVEKIGFVTHPSLPGSGCSPDCLVGDVGMAQVKAPDQHTHLGYLLNKEIPRGYFLQMQWEMACTQRDWSDFVSYDPDQQTRLRLSVVRVMRDEETITLLEHAAMEFNKEIDQLVEQLMAL
ncbi:MAG: lambda exonuclease family protein [Methyloglobulus sp.]